jgi:hypothetical protein
MERNFIFNKEPDIFLQDIEGKKKEIFVLEKGFVF